MSAQWKLGPWPLGIDNVSVETKLKRDQNGRTIALRDAFNVDIDRDGKVSRRRGRALAVALPGLHSVWTGRSASFGVARGVLYVLNAGGATPVTTLGSDDPCDYTELNGAVIVANRTTLIEVTGSGWRRVGVPDAPAPTLAADANGGLPAGRYSLAIAYLRGHEVGALSVLQTVTLAEGQGIRLTLPALDPEATGIRVYRTTPGGAVLYRCTDVPSGLGSYLIGSEPLGSDTPTQYLTRMLPGEFVTYWRGLLLVGRGRTIFWSEPMNYGLTSLRHNFVQLPFRIRMLAGVGGGVFVGSAGGVKFLRGQQPKTWELVDTSGHPPVSRCSTEIDGESLDNDFQQGGQNSALWLADNGFVLGTESGSLIVPQANRLRIPLALSGSLVVHDRRATAVTS